MTTKTLGIKVVVNGAKKAAGQLSGFTSKTTGSLALVAGQFLVFKAAAESVLQSLSALYSSIIQSNEQLAQSILKSQTALAGNFRIIDAFGNEIEDVGEKILATEDTIRNALLKLEKETRDLVGVTSQTTTDAFNIVLGEGGRFLQGQTKIYADEVEASIALTKGLVAALGTEGLGIDQARQEFRALVQGDLRNPDAQLARKLNIDQAEFDTARAEGELADFLASQFEVYTEANKLASESIEGVSSNLVDIFEVASRTAGATLRESLVDALQDVFNFVTRFEDEILELAGQTGEAFNNVFLLVREALTSIVLALRPLLPAAMEITDVLFQAAEGLGKIGRLLQSINTGAFLEPLERALPIVGELGEKLDNLTQGLANVGGTGFRAPQALAARLNGDFKDIEGALQANTSRFAILTAEAERFADALSNAELRQDTSGVTQYRALLGQVLEDLKDQEIAVEGIATADAKQIAEKEEQLALIREQVEELEALGVATNQITLQNNPLQEFGDTADAIEEQLQRAFDQVATQGGGQAEQFKAAVEEAAQLVGTLESIGAIDTTEAVGRLRDLLNDPAVRPEQRLQLEKQLLGVIEAGSKRRLETFQTELAQLETAVAAGTVSSSDAAVQRADIAREQALERLSSAQQRLSELETTGTDQNSIASAREEIAQLTAEVERLAIEAENIRLDEAIRLAEQAAASAQAEIARLISSTNLAIQTAQAGTFASQAELQQELLRSEAQANGQLQQLLQQRIQAVTNAANAATGDRRTQLENELNELVTQFTDAQLAAASQADELIALEQQAAAERRALLGQEFSDQQAQQRAQLELRRATGAQVAQVVLAQEAQLQRQLAEQARASAEDRLQEARDAEQAQTADGRLAQEAELRDAMSARYQAELDFITAVASETASAREQALAQLEQQADVVRDGFEAERLAAELAIRQRQLALDSEETSIELAELRTQEAEQELEFAKQRLELAQELAASDENADNLQVQDQLREATEDVLRNEIAVVAAKQDQKDLDTEATKQKQIQSQTDPLGSLKDQLKALQQQINLQKALSKIEQDKFKLGQSFLDNRTRELDVALELKRELVDNADIGDAERALIKDRLRGLDAVRKSETRLAKEREAAVRKQAKLELEALDAKFRAERIQLRLELEAAQVQSKISQLSGGQTGPSPQELLAQARLDASEATFEAERSRLRSDLGDEVFEAERATARAADRSGSNVRRRSQANAFGEEGGLAPIGEAIEQVQNFSTAARATFAELTTIANANKREQPIQGNAFANIAGPANPANQLPSITNNFNSPLVNASVARSLGV